MYLFAQLASYLFATFLLGVGVGYALWRAWGEREVIAKYNAAEMRLAAHLARWEKAQSQETSGHAAARTARPPAEYGAGQDVSRGTLEKRWEETARRELHEFEVKHTAELHEFEAKQAALMRESEDAAIRKAEAAAEKKLADLARRLGDDFKAPSGAMGSSMGSVMGASLGAGMGAAVAASTSSMRKVDDAGPRLPLAGAPIIDPHAAAETQFDANGEQVGS